MPLYEYRCTQCGHRFDKIQKFNDEPETACPKCGGALERPLTAPALQFKGAGWYVNDYAAKPAGGGTADKISAEAAPAGEKKTAEAKSESKPAEAKPAAGSSTPSTGSSPAASTAPSKSE